VSRVRRATFTPEYRMDRLERFARGLGLNVIRDRNTLAFDAADRGYKVKVAGRTTVRVSAYVDGALEAELVVSDERAEAVLARVAPE